MTTTTNTKCSYQRTTQQAQVSHCVKHFYVNTLSLYLKPPLFYDHFQLQLHFQENLKDLSLHNRISELLQNVLLSQSSLTKQPFFYLILKIATNKSIRIVNSKLMLNSDEGSKVAQTNPYINFLKNFKPIGRFCDTNPTFKIS